MLTITVSGNDISKMKAQTIGFKKHWKRTTLPIYC